ncbi:MAG: class I SAM-dependent DNA methyltransferase [Desulfotomaculales bacterium]
MYEDLAEIYDFLVAGVDYEAWVDYLEEMLDRFGRRRPETVAELACGTGKILFSLARRGYRVWGVDISARMIAAAGRKARELGLPVDLRVQDMRDFRLEKPVELVVCFHDGLNYLTEFSGLVRAFRSVRRNLAPGGLFVFDVNTLTWLAGLSGEAGEYREENLHLAWETSYDRTGPFWEIRLEACIRGKGGEKKFTEVHRERGYTPGEVVRALSLAGLEALAAYDAFTFEPVRETSRRHFHVARRPGDDL